MKTTLYLHLIFLLSFSLIISTIQGQVVEPERDRTDWVDYNQFTLKQKRQKTAAWIMLGGGVVMTLVGLTLNTGDELVEGFTLGLADVPKSHEGPIVQF